MARTAQHIIRHPDGWSVKKGGSKRATKVFKTQEEAIAHGRELSKRQGADLYIHRSNGLVREKNSYGTEKESTRSSG